MASAQPPAVPNILVPEILGFVPQYLLDDVIDTANDAVRQAVDAMEVFLRRWATGREEKAGGDWDSTQDVEQGLVAFQTLLNHHVDLAFDLFEVWSMRNIFAIPADLPIVTPHQEGLNLEQPPEKEAELLDEIEKLRRQIHAQRKLQRLYTLAVRKSAVERAKSQKRLERLAFLRSPQLETLSQLPKEFLAMYAAVSALPPHDPSLSSEQMGMPMVQEPGKRPWETSKTGYLNWAVEQLVSKAKSRGTADDGKEGSSAVDAVVNAAYGVGEADHVKDAVETLPEGASTMKDGRHKQRSNHVDER